MFAHQYLDQCTADLKASFAANTGIKFAGGVSSSDARSMATDMRTTADFILSQPRLHFATFIRHITPQAVSVPVELGHLDGEPTLSEADFEQLIERNRERVSYKPGAISPLPVKDDSFEW